MGEPAHPLTALAVTTGKAFTVPLAATFCVIAPVDPEVILPEGVPEADDERRTYIGVELTVPLDGVSDMLLLYVPPDVKHIWKPDGAVTTILAVNPVPLTEKLCEAEAVPEQVVNGDKVPEVETLVVTPRSTTRRNSINSYILHRPIGFVVYCSSHCC